MLGAFSFVLVLVYNFYMNGEHIHITKDGTFKSDKYSWCPEGFFALKFTDPVAQEAILYYASRIEDKTLANDLHTAVLNAQK